MLSNVETICLSRRSVMKIKCKLVFEDWRQRGQLGSIYNSEYGLRLSSGDLHSGTTFPAVVEIDDKTAGDIVKAGQLGGAYPVFAIVDASNKEE
jgi:hypothetical protein